MQVVGRELIDEFIKQHQDSERPLNRWLSHAQGSDWDNFTKLKETFGSADYYKGATIFDIGGNKFRLIARINYTTHRIVIDYVMTHQEYDQNRWKKKYEST